MSFDPSAALERLDRMWSLGARFGLERDPERVYLEEIVSDRAALLHGMQVVRDELQFAGADGRDVGDLIACRAAFAQPSVVTTLAHTNCGDRIHTGDATHLYESIVAQRFATMSETGGLKLEAFFPTGGGTDDAMTLAHVTVGHQLDQNLRRLLYEGNPRSFVLAGLDLRTHVGRLDEGGVVRFGRTRESPWREPRPACGAIVGALGAYSADNPVHRRLRDDLGEANFAWLSSAPLRTDEGVNITAAVAAAIVAVRGMRRALVALRNELDERGVGHATACLKVNRTAREDTIVYLARGTVFQGEVRVQGLGVDATKYGGRLIEDHGEDRLVLTYDGLSFQDRPFPIETVE